MEDFKLDVTSDDFIPTALFVARIQQFIESEWEVKALIEFPMGDGQVYRRDMQVLSILDGQDGYECQIKNYGITLIPYGSRFTMTSP
jgi:hypothetical protein